MERGTQTGREGTDAKGARRGRKASVDLTLLRDNSFSMTRSRRLVTNGDR